MIENYVPGSDIQPSELNAFQADHEARFAKWYTIGLNTAQFGDADGAGNYIFALSKEKGFNILLSAADHGGGFYLDTADFPVGSASPARTRRYRYVVDLATNIIAPGSRITAAALHPVTGTTATTLTLGTAVTGSTISPGVLPANMELTRYESSELTLSTGLYAIRVVLAAPVLNSMVVYWGQLQVRIA